MTIIRIDQGARFSEAVVCGDLVFLSGQLGEPGQSVVEQTRTALSEIDLLLDKTGSDRSHLLSATILLADISDYGAMNNEWDAWIAGHPAPARATYEARLFSSEYRVEIVVTAARVSSRYKSSALID